MAMTIGSWQKELHREQIKLGKIISALRKKKDLKNAEKLEKINERLRALAYQPVGDGGMVMPQRLDSDGRIAVKNSLTRLRDIIDKAVDKLETDGKIDNLIVFLSEMHDIAKEILRVIGGSGNAGKVQGMSDAEIVLEESEKDCPCAEVTMVNAKIVNTGNVKDSFSIEFSEGGVDKNLMIEVWAECGKTTPEIRPGECYDFMVNVKPACSAYGVSQVGLSDRIMITVESVLEEVDKDSKYLRVNVK